MFPAFAPHSAVLPDLQAAEDPEQVRAVGEVDDDVRRGLPQRDEHRQLLPLVAPYLVLGRHEDRGGLCQSTAVAQAPLTSSQAPPMWTVTSNTASASKPMGYQPLQRLKWMTSSCTYSRMPSEGPGVGEGAAASGRGQLALDRDGTALSVKYA